jgi:hypothetical protein
MGAEGNQQSVETLRRVGDLLKGALPPGIGFALFIAVAAEVAYLSTGNREDVVKSLEEWLENMEGRAFVNSTSFATAFQRDETLDETEKRLALEEACENLGKVMVGEGESKLALFLFNFGPNGHIAYYMNTDFRGRIRNWIAKHRGRS